MKLNKDIEKLLLPSVRIPPFCPDEYDVDIVELIKPWQDVKSADVGIVGAPFDTAVVSRRGSKWGPRAVREALIMWSHYHVDREIDLSKDISIVDFGDIDVLHTDVYKTHERVERVLTAIYELGVVPILIGGDHSLAYPGIKALCNVMEGNVGMIGFDSHIDVRVNRHGEPSSGTPFRRALEETGGKVKRIIEIGINGWHNAKVYHEYTKEKGIKIITARDVHLKGPERVAQEALDFVTDGVDALYMTLDVDALDISCMSGTCIPSPGGLLAWEGLELVYAFASHPLMRGMDHVEISPSLDTNNGVSQTTGSALLMEMLAGVKTGKTIIS